MSEWLLYMLSIQSWLQERKLQGITLFQRICYKAKSSHWKTGLLLSTKVKQLCTCVPKTREWLHILRDLKLFCACTFWCKATRQESNRRLYKGRFCCPTKCIKRKKKSIIHLWQPLKIDRSKSKKEISIQELE